MVPLRKQDLVTNQAKKRRDQKNLELDGKNMVARQNKKGGQALPCGQKLSIQTLWGNF